MRDEIILVVLPPEDRRGSMRELKLWFLIAITVLILVHFLMADVLWLHEGRNE